MPIDDFLVFIRKAREHLNELEYLADWGSNADLRYVVSSLESIVEDAEANKAEEEEEEESEDKDETEE